jgi:flagellar motility protein MotE (MotC chaperone)
MSDNHVHPREVAALLREMRRLLENGAEATYEEWLNFHERKADLLQRIAADPGELVDVDEAQAVADDAAQQFESLRAQPPLFGGAGACR